MMELEGDSGSSVENEEQCEVRLACFQMDDVDEQIRVARLEIFDEVEEWQLMM